MDRIAFTIIVQLCAQMLSCLTAVVESSVRVDKHALVGKNGFPPQPSWIHLTSSGSQNKTCQYLHSSPF